MKLKELLAITNKGQDLWVKTSKDTIIFGNPIEVRNKLKIRNKEYLLRKVKNISTLKDDLVVIVEEL